jgi:DNA-binding response OmpR family regulator
MSSAHQEDALAGMNERVLLVEDDDDLRRTLALVLRASGMTVIESADGDDAVHRFQTEGADVIVLDVMLPGRDGFDVCRAIRSGSAVPIVIVTARDAASDVITGLELGADDYVVKPFESAVLLARLRAVLRRANPEDEPTLRSGAMCVDTIAWRAWHGDDELDLTATEMRLLVELIRHEGQVLSREVLLERVWHYDYLGDSRLVDMAIKRLRDKIAVGTDAGSRIRTVRGVGYRLDPA